MTLNQHLDYIKQILKKENLLNKATTYINKQNITDDEKDLLIRHAKVIVKKKKENKTAWTMVGCLAVSGVFIFATFFVFVTYNTNNPDIENLLDALDVILFRAIPIGTTILALIIATTMSEEESYGMRFIKASVISGLVCYVLAFFVVLVGL